ncbi:MAG: ROK family protein [Clostridia bacterium]|jgi:glucokinase|nr:ROK family protein [Clostridia bacterium]
MYYLGIDVGGMSIKGGLIDEKGNILFKESVPTMPERDYKDIIEDIAALCDTLIGKENLKKNDLKGIGVGIPGTIDPEKGVIVYANNINFKKVPIKKELSKYFTCPIKIGNDANVAAFGELKFGAGKGARDLILITLGTGIGTGIIVDNQIILGKGGAGGEGGHIGFKYNGKKCSCGKRGCWEAYASASALIKMTEKAISKNPLGVMAEVAREEGKVSGKTAFIAEKKGDKEAQKVVSNYVKYVSDGIISLVNIFRPDLVLIGGGISNEGDALMKRIQQRVNRFSYGGKINPKITIKKALLMNDAGILGAAALCI